MKTLELLKNLKALSNTKAIKGGIDAVVTVNVTSMSITCEYDLTDAQSSDSIKIVKDNSQALVK